MLPMNDPGRRNFSIQDSHPASQNGDQHSRAVDAVRLGVWRWNVATGVISWSPDQEALHGLSTATFDGTETTFQALVHPEDWVLLKAGAVQSVETGNGLAVAYRGLHPDGSTRWCFSSGSVLPPGTDSSQELSGVTIGLSTEPLVTTARGGSPSDHQRLFESIPVPLWVFDLATLRFLTVNDAAISQYGFGRRDVLHQTLLDLASPEAVPILREKLLSASVDRVDISTAGIQRLRRRDGGVVEAEVTLQALSWSGRPAGLLAALDVTHRGSHTSFPQRRYDDFSATFEQAPVGFGHAALDGRWLRVNQRFCELVGYSRQVLLTRTFQEITYPPDLEPDLVLLRQLVSGDLATYELEKRYVRQDGTLLWVHDTVSLVHEATGSPDYVLRVVEDISRRKGADAERERLTARLDAERTLLQAVLQQLPVGVTIVEAPSGQVVLNTAHVDPPSRDPKTSGQSANVGGPARPVHPDGRPYEPADLPLMRAIASGAVVTGEEIAFQLPDAAIASFRVNAAPVRDPDNRVIAGVATFDDITSSKRIEARQRILVEASAILSSIWDDETTLARVAHLAVPALGNLCMIDLLDEEGSLRRLAVAHDAPECEALIWELDRQYPAFASAFPGVSDVLRGAGSNVCSNLPNAALDTTPHGRAYRDVIKSLDLRSSTSVPLVAGAKTLGVFTCAVAVASNRQQREDVPVLEQLGHRVAGAVDNARLYASERRARKYAEHVAGYISRLQTVTAALAEILSPEQVAMIVVEQAVAALDAAAGSMARPANDGISIEIIHSVGYPDDVIAAWRRFPATAPVALADAIRTGDLIVLRSPAELIDRYPQLAPAISSRGHQAIAAVPLTSDGRVLGSIGLSFANPRPFDADDQAFLVALGQQGGQAIARVQLYEAERRARDEAEAAEQAARREAARLATLAQSSRAFAEAGLDFQSALNAVARITAEQTGDCCIVRLLSPDEKWAEVAAIHHPNPDLLAAARVIVRTQPASQGFSAEVLRTGRALLLPEVPPERLRLVVEPDAWSVLDHYHIHSLLVVALRARDRVIGTLALLRSTSNRPFTREDEAFLQDLADRAALAIDNARLYREAQTALAARDEFLSMAAHELRTPITSVKGYAQLLLRSAERNALAPERTAEFLHAIDDAADRLRTLADDLLDVSRIQMGHLPLRPRPIDLADLAAVVVTRYHALLGDRHPLTIDVSPQPTFISVDPDRTEQILNNLIDNAAKHSPEGTPITLSLAPKDSGVLLTVSDSGTGLQPGEAESIFEPFHRGSNALRDSLPGLGLGLYICRGIAERHGGRIWATSPAEGCGVAVHLWLPPVPPDAAA